MPDASRVFTVTTPPGNGVATPVSYPLSLGLAEVVNCIITFPAGCSGLVGCQLMAAHTAAFPQQANTYLAFDDWVYPFGITGQIQTGDWYLLAYNADYFPHTLQVVLEYDYVLTSAAPSPSFAVGI